MDVRIVDHRLNTFLTLCQTMNYRQAAQQLHLTQPAVTRQIQSLEQSFGVKLFCYDGRKLTRTAACRLLEEYAISLRGQYQELTAALQGAERTSLRVGTTKTVGDYIAAPLVQRYLSDPRRGLSLVVDNTRRLLELLDDNQLDCALVEGFFDRRRYDYHLFRQEPFGGICAAGHPFAGRKVSPEELFTQTLLVREPGSGTRNIFEQELADRGYTLASFARVVSAGSFSLIKQLLLGGVGVTFAYQAIARGDPRFAFFTVGEAPSLHEFNFVYLKHTGARHLVDAFLGEEGQEESGKSGELP